MDALRDKLPWLFGSHYKMERFGVTFLALCLLLGTSVGLIVHKHSEDQKQQLGTQVSYTTQFVMSRSRATGTVESVNVSKDGTRCLVFLKWDDTTNVSTVASDYQMFLTGTDLKLTRQDLLCSPAGSVYVLGNSGYMALYLVDQNGFPSQIVDLVLRSNNDFLSPEGVIPDSRGDGSFETYDQARIYFNPGGADRTTLSCLEDDSMTADSIYNSVVSEPAEANIKKQMEEALAAMKQAQAQIASAENTLMDMQITIPDAPYLIAGDTIETAEDGTMELVSGIRLAGGYDFDWRNLDLKTGYLDTVLEEEGAGSARDLAQKKSDEVDALPFETSSLQWYSADGTQISVSQTSSDMSQAEVLTNKAITSLINAWTAFYEAKVEYQVTLPSQLLELEIMANDITAHYSVNSENVLTLY